VSTGLIEKQSWTLGPGKGITVTRRELLMSLGALLAALVVAIPVAGRFVHDARLSSAAKAESSIQASALVPLAPDASPVDTGDVSVPVRADFQADTGAALLAGLNMRDKIVYIAYGRPSKQGEQTWGTLGASQTAEQSWQVLRANASAVGMEIGQDSASFALNVLNPVYRSQNGVVADVYIRKALELAPENHGLVALDFDTIADAEATVQRLEATLPQALLVYLGVGLDIEHFPGGRVDAALVNAFSRWFAGKHHEWAGDAVVPGLVLVYTFRDPGGGGQGAIDNLGQLVQYYLAERTLVVPVFDGYGARQDKAEKVGQLVRALPNTRNMPALVGVMEFRSRWGTKYDQATIGESFEILAGAPVYFFASQ
jgi:hypothetical protein